ncbi:3-dehydroquinate synthase [Deinococcus sp. YIM 77859]|uniref:3-dehydroquinate synthase n=1 Tax=Deinococcus sp. YIM 77859 TaxID=1540221 RepID=UPI0005550100|nr:3-dehydroquinate synthase [Deinococcus sp. YIM 77859]
MTRVLEQTVPVTFRYAVHFTHGLFQAHNPVLCTALASATGEPAKVLCVLDGGVSQAFPDLGARVAAYFAAHADALHLVAPPLTVPGGERVKQEAGWVRAVQDAIHMHGIDRHSYVVVVGGGAVLDMVGFAAATAHRGVRLVRVPTTVLAQNDSGVGVKNSVNAYGKKNWLGTFAPPYAVLNDLTFLTALEDRDWLGGLAEAVKVALLKDAAFFAWLEEQAGALVARDLEAMEYAVYRCAELHLAHIAGAGDPFELGSSRPLDFGHWAAHKLESLTGYALRHGEAVAVGLALDCTYGALQGMLPETDWQRVLRLLLALKLPVYVPELGTSAQDPADPRGVLSGLNEFREHLGGRLTIPLLTAIGHATEVHAMDADVLRRSVELLRDLHDQPRGASWLPTPTLAS